MTSLLFDSLLVIAVYLYVFAIIKIGEALKARGHHPSVTRKLIHLFAGDCVVAVGWWLSPLWPALIPIGLLIMLSYMLLRRRRDPIVQSMFWSKRGGLHNYGALYYIASILVLLPLFWKEKSVIVASTFVMAWGDGMAPLVVDRLGSRMKYPWTDRSLEGSLAMFVFGTIGAAFGMKILGFSGLALPWNELVSDALLAGLVGAATEAFSLGPLEPFDNFTVPLVTALVLYLT